MGADESRIEQLEQRLASLEVEVEHLRAEAARDTSTASTPAPIGVSFLPPPPTGPPVQVGPPGGASVPPGRLGEPSGGSPSGPTGPRWPEPTTESVLKWGGVGLVVTAVGFAVSSAIRRGWIGPELQLLAAFAFGIALIVVGLRLEVPRWGWAQALCSGGVVALAVAAASNLMIDVTGRTEGLFVTVIVAAVGLGLAWNLRSEWTATATVISVAIGSLVLEIGDRPHLVYVLWGVVLAAAAVALSIGRKWFALRLVGHVAVLLWVLGAAGIGDDTTEGVVTLVAAGVVWTSFLFVPSIGDRTSVWQQLEIQLAALVAPWTLLVVAVSFDIDSSDRLAIIAFAIALASALCALALRKGATTAHYVSLVLGASVTASIGLAMLLSTDATFLAFAVQGAGLVVLSRYLDGRLRLLANAFALFFISGAAAFARMIEAWDVDATVGRDLAHLLIIGVLVVGALLTAESVVKKLVAAVCLVLLMTWLGSVLVHVPQGQAVVSVSWAAVGIAVLVVGAMLKQQDVGMVGLLVLGVTVAKLLTIDLREVETLWRAALFLVIGLGLLRIGFVLPRLTGASEPHQDL